MPGRLKLVLASGSVRRLQLLNQIGVEPDRLMPTAIDEAPKRHELPRNLAKRLAREKAGFAPSRPRRGSFSKVQRCVTDEPLCAAGRVFP